MLRDIRVASLLSHPTPFLYPQVDVFVVLTDSETWKGGIHPAEALKQYRAKTGIPARLLVRAHPALRASESEATMRTASSGCDEFPRACLEALGQRGLQHPLCREFHPCDSVSPRVTRPNEPLSLRAAKISWSLL